MSFQNTQEHEDRPVHPRHRLRLRDIRTIYHLKLWRVWLFFTLFTVFCYIMSVWFKGVLSFIPWESLATTSLGVTAIGFVYEWVVRNETKQELDEVLDHHFEDQAKTIDNQISRAMLLTPDIMRDVLKDDMVDNVIRTSLEIRLGNTQLAREAYDSFLSHLLNHEERRSNYHSNIYLTSITATNLSDEVMREYYDASIDVRYDTLLQKDAFRFVCVGSQDDYNEMLKDPSWELRWMSRPTKDFSKEEAFQVEFVHIGELELNMRPGDANGKYVIVADHLELQSLQGKLVRVYYRYRVKIKKRGHLLMIHMPCPTHNMVVELDYTHTDIHFVNVRDFIVSKIKPAVRYLPSRQNPQRIWVEVNGWVFPKGGVVFVWVLRAERNPGFWKLSTTDTRRSNRSKTNPSITNPLPNVLSELE